jgi:recombinational DNA repair ATPase RecF
MHRAAKLAADRATDMQRMADAFDPLYASFSPEQKQTANKLFHDMAMHRGGHGPHRDDPQPG